MFFWVWQLGKKFWREYIVVSVVSIIFLIVGLIILVPTITVILGFGDGDKDFSELQHVNGELKYFSIEGENSLNPNDDAPNIEGDTNEAFFVIHLWSSNDIFIYDSGGKNYELARNTLLGKKYSKGVIIDIWADTQLHSRSFLMANLFRNILQLSVDGQLLISYDDVLGERKEQALGSTGVGGAFALIGVLFALIVYRRRWDWWTDY